MQAISFKTEETSFKVTLDGLFKIYFLSCMYTPFLAGLIPLPGLNLLDDLIFFSILPFCIYSIKSGQNKIDLLVLTLPVYILFSCILSVFNGEDLTVILLSLKNIKNLFLFFILISLRDDNTEFIKRHILFFLFASIPVAVFQFFTVTHQDDITGLFGPKSTSLYSFLVIVFVATYATYYGLNKVKWLWLLFIPVFLNETKITFILFPAILLTLLLISKKIKIKHFFILLIIGSIFFNLLNEIYLNLYGYAFSEIFNYDYLETYLFEYTDLHNDIPRFYRLFVAYTYLDNSSLFDFYFGYGLGSEYVGGNGETLGIVAKDFEYTLLNQGTRIQLFQMLLDYGVLGSIIFCCCLLLFLVKISIKKITFDNLFTVAMLLVMLFSLVYQNMFFTKQLSFVLFYFVYMSMMKKIQFK
ncbi:O-antigen polymerase [Pseudoalteromonas sp. R86517]|uniref:O-antigen polymerase n=1 Tax=Pseudoalteromonas sp. R86517 TaxID=3093857 RepID=UPI00366EBC0A